MVSSTRILSCCRASALMSANCLSSTKRASRSTSVIAVGDPELISVKARVVLQKRPRHPMVVGLEPDVVSEAKVHDRIGDLARCRVGHHPFNPPEPIAVGGVHGRSLGMVAGDQPAVSTAIAGCCGSKALLGAHSMLLRHSPSRT